MKKVAIFLVLFSCLKISIAQNSSSGFDVNKMFFGGSVVLGYGGGNSSQFTIGGNPELGYSILKNIDLGVSGNYTYSSQSYFDGAGTKALRITQTGLGLFGRLHITDGFFVQAQPEFNNIKYKQFYKEQPSISVDGTLKSTSFLVGVGFGTHDVGNANFFTVILIDLNKDLYSPYRTSTGDISPVIRGGVNFYFKRRKK